MAQVDKDGNRRMTRDEAQDVPVFLRYPEDQIDFGYEIALPVLSGARHGRDADGLSLVARVYE